MNNNGALRKNLTSNIVLFLLNGIISFWLPPFLIRKLGIGAYGIIPLSTAIVGYAALVTVAINGSLSRYLAIDIAEKNFDKASRTFNTSYVAMSVLVVCLLPIMIYGSLNISSLISIPNELIGDSNLLFICVTVSFALTCFSSLFNSSAYVANRLDLVNRVTVINTYVRLIFIFLIFFAFKISLLGYGISFLAGSLISAAYSYYLFRKYTPFISLTFKSFDNTILKDLLSMGGWLVVIQLGTILFLQIDLLVANKMLGNHAAGQYGVLLQWSTMVRTFAITLSGALAPLVLNLYAQKKKQEMIRLTLLSNKLLTLFISCGVGVLCIVSKPLLTVWVGKGIGEMYWLFIIMLIPLPLNLGVLPLFSINRAYNKVRVPGIFTCVMGIINLLLAISLIRFTNLKLYGIAIASAVVLTMKNFLFMPIYTAMNMGVPKITFFRSSISSILIMLISIGLMFVYKSYVEIKNWGGIVFHCGFLFLLLAAISFLLLSRSEKESISSSLLKRK
ncbi:lipopolysaccharide biosynthesis protein [Pedobacter psychrodurus]|uniref:lipopolysaccharide biosynthesis protein n=1 Tax=Pedobacter psychrodurus TaxID=2530456 RepID=UPI0029317F0A|nr:oligosaccharide flippase family protein [Pedobacter psychrodurus]